MNIKWENGYKVFDLPNGGQLLWAEEDRVLFSRPGETGIALTTDPDTEFDGMIEALEQAVVERDQLRKDLEEAKQALDEPRRELLLKIINERDRVNNWRSQFHKVFSERERAREESVQLRKELEEARKNEEKMMNREDLLIWLQDLLHNKNIEINRASHRLAREAAIDEAELIKTIIRKVDVQPYTV